MILIFGMLQNKTELVEKTKAIKKKIVIAQEIT